MKRGCLIPIVLLVLILMAGAVRYATLPPLSREYTRRIFTMFESDVKDYLRFPKREIAAAPEPYLLPSNFHPEWFESIAYTNNGHPAAASVDDLMENTRTQALIVIKDGEVVHEKYYNGYQRDSIVTSFSTAKSFNSAMIGIAITDGLIGSVDDPFVHYLPEFAGRGLDEMTIRDLLMMSSGIAYIEDENLFPLFGAPFSDDAKTYYYPDLRALAVENVRRGAEPVGQFMHYNNYHPILEGMILERVTGMPVAAYLEQTIWQPMGAEAPASWSLDSEQTAFEKMESGINARAIDFARFGLLFLNNGNWNGRQVVPESWVKESTSPDPADQRESPQWPWYRDNGGYYRYHWWGNVRPDGHYDYTASGAHGQYIYVCPQKRLVIDRFGEGDPGVDSLRAVLYAIEEGIP